MIIDTHAHALDAAFLQGLCRTPRFGLSAERDTAGRFCVRRGEGAPVSLDDDLSNIARRIESLRRRKVGLQLTGPPPGFASWPGGAASVEYARTLNEHGAQVVAQGQGHLELMVTLPLGEPESCAYELERALDLYGARSALLPATAGGRPLDTGTFDRMFSLAERCGIAVPASGIGRATIAIPGLRIATRRAMAGRDFIRRCTDDLRRVLRALSAAKDPARPWRRQVLFLKGRLNSAYEARGAEGDPYFTSKIAKPPGDYFSQLYFTCSQSPESVEFTIRIAGPDRVMYGTDYPFEIGDPEGRRALPALESLPQGIRQKIFHDNAATVLDAVHPTSQPPA
jgi:aminocarboxymuconate-semialdehyde decarboxylase